MPSMEARSLHIFFFQAEDGIRALYVTGVQTCALPIFGIKQSAFDRVGRADIGFWGAFLDGHADGNPRSEERRVGKECRSRRSPSRQKTKPRHPIDVPQAGVSEPFHVAPYRREPHLQTH